MTRLGIYGKTGKMAQSIFTASKSFSVFSNLELCGRNDDLGNFISSSDLIIDFSINYATHKLLQEMQAYPPKPILIGTTALTEETFKLLDSLSEFSPVMHTSNVSLGANLQAALVRKLAKVLKKDYDPEILEIHHKHKKDSPSGTALMLANAINSGYSDAGMTDSQIVNKPRINESDAICISSVRAGENPGEHQVSFCGTFDELQITHRAFSREMFAISAINVILWLKTQNPGRYYMTDIIKI